MKEDGGRIKGNYFTFLQLIPSKKTFLMVLLQVNRGVGGVISFDRCKCCAGLSPFVFWAGQINIFSNKHVLRKNTFAYLPKESKLFNMKAGKR